MKTNHTKFFLSFISTALLFAVTLFVTPLPQNALAFEKVQGQDKTGKNCERIDTPGSSTFGKCENVCKDKEVTRDAPNNRWVCKATKVTGAQTGLNHVPLNGQVLDAGNQPSTKAPRAEGVKAGKAKKKN